MDRLDETAAELIPRVVRERAVFPVYQPIADLDTGKIVGAEALARGPAGTAVESASGLFAAARQAGMLSAVDQLCFSRAIEGARQVGDDAPPLLFANAEPAVTDQPIPPELLDMVRAPRPFRIVTEYAERSLESDPAALIMLAGMAYADGNAVALDDVGAEPMSVAFLAVLEPAVIKLDASLVRHPDAATTVGTVGIVNAYVERTGAVVIAEGIETERDMATAMRLGAVWGQGWMFGKPGPLREIAGRDTQPAPALPEPRPYVPDGAAFTVVAERSPVRTVDRHTLQELANGLLHVAAASGPHTTILATYSDEGMRSACQAALSVVENTAAYVRAAPPHSSHAQTPPETALVAVAPHTATALCAQPTADGRFEVVSTTDPARAHIVARMLINSSSPYPRFGR